MKKKCEFNSDLSGSKGLANRDLLKQLRVADGGIKFLENELKIERAVSLKLAERVGELYAENESRKYGKRILDYVRNFVFGIRDFVFGARASKAR
jgi:hypothetical protein